MRNVELSNTFIFLLITFHGLIYIFIQVKATVEEHFDWKALVNWPSSSESEEERIDPPLTYPVLDHHSSFPTVPTTTSLDDHNDAKKGIKRGRQIPKDLQDLSRGQRNYYRTKNDEVRFEKARETRKKRYQVKKARKEAFLNTLTETERTDYAEKEKQRLHKMYVERKANGKIKSKTGVLLERIKQKESTFEDLNEIQRRRRKSTIQSRNHRERQISKFNLVLQNSLNAYESSFCNVTFGTNIRLKYKHK